ncbi:reverse transcriptase-like protein, partial [Gelidibacter salicanalis]
MGQDLEYPFVQLDRPDLALYPDGSKEAKRVGIGWAVTCADQVVAENSIRLDEHATVFQAEVEAIRSGLKWWQTSEKHKEKSLKILTDSQAAVGALKGKFVTSNLVGETKSVLKQ